MISQMVKQNALDTLDLTGNDNEQHMERIHLLNSVKAFPNPSLIYN